MLKNIAIAAALLIVAAVIYAWSRPDAFRFERSIAIKAPPEKILPLIDTMRAWEAWTPYNKDPAMKHAYTGPERGVGAGYAWDGNSEVGKGRIEVTQSVPNSRVAMDLVMEKPFAARNNVEFTLQPKGDATTVTWTLYGRYDSLIPKLMCLVFNSDKMVGGDFERGLARLKAIAEK